MTFSAIPALPYGRRSPTWLHRRLAAVFGANLTGLWIGEDIAADASGNVTSWPSRVGPLLSVTVVGTGTLKLTKFNGRTAAISSGGSRFLYDVSLAALKSHWLVSNSQATLAQWARLADFSPIDPADGQLSTFGNNMYALYEGGMWRHYVNGAFTATLPAGAGKFVAEGYSAANARTGISLFGSAVLGWVQPIDFCMALNALPLAAQRSSGVAIIREYNGF